MQLKIDFPLNTIFLSLRIFGLDLFVRYMCTTHQVRHQINYNWEHLGTLCVAFICLECILGLQILKNSCNLSYILYKVNFSASLGQEIPWIKSIVPIQSYSHNIYVGFSIAAFISGEFQSVIVKFQTLSALEITCNGIWRYTCVYKSYMYCLYA